MNLPPIDVLERAELPTLKGRHLDFWPGRCLSFKVAVSGAWHTLSTQPNARIEVLAVGLLLISGVWLQINAMEWALIALSSGMVLALEAINTAIEEILDFISPRYHRQAKIAKDTAAGALIFAALGSTGVALAIFGPRIWHLLA